MLYMILHATSCNMFLVVLQNTDLKIQIVTGILTRAPRKCDLHVLRELGLVDYSLLMAFHEETKRVRLAIIDFLQPYTLKKQSFGRYETDS